MIVNIFSTPIYTDMIRIDDEMKHSLITNGQDHINPQTSWRCNTKSSIGRFEPHSEDLYKSLFANIKLKIMQFSTDFGITDRECEITESWINFADKGDYQEYHLHTNSHFSFVYYVEAQEGNGNIVFKSHECDTDMFPLPNDHMTGFSFKTYSIAPKTGQILIFRSNIQHMVEQNLKTMRRISISGNCVFE